jgi:hypothetical protein
VVRQRISQESTPSSSRPAQTNSQSRSFAEMLAQMALGPQRVFGDVIIDPDEEDDAQIDEEQERENGNVIDAPPIDFPPAEDGDNGNNNNENAGVLTILSCLLRLMIAQHSQCPQCLLFSWKNLR